MQTCKCSIFPRIIIPPILNLRHIRNLGGIWVESGSNLGRIWVESAYSARRAECEKQDDGVNACRCKIRQEGCRSSGRCHSCSHYARMLCRIIGLRAAAAILLYFSYVVVMCLFIYSLPSELIICAMGWAC
eukprot:6609247-Pyramimonas_sp.AAC.1